MRVTVRVFARLTDIVGAQEVARDVPRLIKLSQEYEQASLHPKTL